MVAFFQSLHKTLAAGVVLLIAIVIVVGLIGGSFIKFDQAYWLFFARWLHIMTGGDTIDVADLPSAVRSPSGGFTAPKQTSGDGEPAKAGTLREFKDNAERAYLVQKLRDNGWNISKTAEAIDTPRSNLYKKLEQYQISQESDG